MSRIIAISVIALFCLLCGCGDGNFFADDLITAREAALERNWPLTERLCQRYLRENQDPEQRWEAWNLLLQAINADSRGQTAALEILSSMVEEYSDDNDKMGEILKQMGSLNERLRRFDGAAAAWSSYLDLAEIDDKNRADAYRKLAAAQVGQRHFEAAEDALQQCLALPLPEHDKIYCMLDLADINSGLERWEEAANLCQQIFDAGPDDQALGMAGYLRGDALEQLGKKEEAILEFEKAMAIYPNPAVIENRLNYLKKDKKE